MFNKGIQSTFLLIKRWEADLIILIVTGAVTAFVAPLDPLSLKNIIHNELGVNFIYGLVIFILLFFFILLLNINRACIEQRNYKLLIELTELKTEGINIRNDIIEELQRSSFNFEKAKAIYENWHNKTLLKYKEINPVRAENWRALDTYPRHRYPTNYPENARKLLDMIREKTKRLESDINTILENICK